MEAIAAHEKEVSQPNYNYPNKETILLQIFKYMPTFIQKNTIQNHFNCSVIFNFSTSSGIVGTDGVDGKSK